MLSIEYLFWLYYLEWIIVDKSDYIQKIKRRLYNNRFFSIIFLVPKVFKKYS